MNWEIKRALAIPCCVVVLAVSSAVAQDQFHLVVRDQIQTYSANGELVQTLELDVPGGLNARALAFDARGTIYTSPLFDDGHIYRFSSSGEPLGPWAEIDQSQASENFKNVTSALEFDSNGLLYAGLNGSQVDDQVERFRSDGSTLGIFGETKSEGLLGAIFDLEFDPGGRLYATDRQNVERFDIDGNNLGVFATTPAMGFGNFPTQLEFDSQGNLYIGTTDDRVYVVSPAGEELHQFEVPHDIFAFAISSDDLLYIGAGGITTPAFVNVYDTTGAFQFEFLRVESDRNPGLLITQTIPEPQMRFHALFAVACFASWRRRHPSAG